MAAVLARACTALRTSAATPAFSLGAVRAGASRPTLAISFICVPSADEDFFFKRLLDGPTSGRHSLGFAQTLSRSRSKLNGNSLGIRQSAFLPVDLFKSYDPNNRSDE
ncbi:hypothetical protein EVAR_22194_1 [Eumeta japonica]|uniref:Uncharacterized protein n=1 Tax=Eumeta variegata TaxID=151549 RepID=A0A4C1UAK1_EUMVA|nr:hypothetical protein EVAR_22194_1 [Eumeta japonica]